MSQFVRPFFESIPSVGGGGFFSAGFWTVDRFLGLFLVLLGLFLVVTITFGLLNVTLGQIVENTMTVLR